jgi:hypothetical protein
MRLFPIAGGGRLFGRLAPGHQLPESFGFVTQAILMKTSTVLIMLGIVATFSTENP